MQLNQSLNDSKSEIIYQLHAEGLRIKEELKSGNTIYLKFKSRHKPRFVTYTITLSTDSNGETVIGSNYAVVWLRFLLNAFMIVGIAFVLLFLNLLLMRESISEGLLLLICNTALLAGLYYRLIHISNKDLLNWKAASGRN